ncbi:hypothetical protein WJX74_011063 [Apatococcus lobatus]|uniref:Uncharacterized protein n=1 Tax=Apatococcus lobatus TaxID=904363 RepID=A0AAW1QU57_9CHLO
MSVPPSLHRINKHQQRCHAWDASRSYEISHIMRRYLLPHLPFQAIMALSRTGYDWHQLITTTSLQQLPTAALAQILPAGLRSQQPFLEVLQQQATLLAKLRGKRAATTLPLKSSFSTHGPVTGLSWSPQSDLSSPSQWLQVSHLHYGNPGSDFPEAIFHSMAVLNLQTGQPVLFNHVEWPSGNQNGLLPTRGLDPTAPSASSVLSSADCNMAMTRAAWVADGQFMAIMSSSQTAGGEEPSDPTESMLTLADLIQQTMTTAINVTGRQERGPGPVSPTGNMICWVQRTPDVIVERAVTSEDRILVYSLPHMQVLCEMGPPTQLPTDKGLQRRQLQVEWSPNGTMFAVLWAVVMPLWPGTKRNRNSHGSFGLTTHQPVISIYHAATGACLGRKILLCPDNDLTNAELVLTCASSPSFAWTPASSHLMVMHAGVIYKIDTGTQEVWRLTYSQRGLQLPSSDLYLPDMATSITLPVSASAHCFCVLDEFTEPVEDQAEVTQAQVSMIEMSSGRLVYRFCSTEEVGVHNSRNVTLATEGNVCLLTELGVVLLAAHDGEDSQSPSWSQHDLGYAQLPDSGDQSDSEDPNCIPGLSLSPCGSIVSGLKSEGNNEWVNSSPKPLSHWHVTNAAADGQNVQPNVSSGNFPCAMDISSLAWHPHPQALVYAVYDVEGTVHLVDARADCQVRSWQAAELLGKGLADADPLPDTSNMLPHLASLKWSRDGCKLAAFKGAACAVISL